VLPRTDRLRRMRDFALLSQRGRVVFGPFFTLRFRQSQAATKIGFVASAKIFKTAVARNRVKRRLREALFLVRPQWPEKMDLLFIARPEATDADFQVLLAAIKRTFEKIPEALKAPPAPRKNPKAKRKTSVIYRGTDK
jgi:ribonuclease P protein component